MAETDQFVSLVQDFGTLGLAIIFCFWGLDELRNTAPWNPKVVQYTLQQAGGKWFFAFGCALYSSFGNHDVLWPQMRWLAIAFAGIAFALTIWVVGQLKPLADDELVP